MLQNAILNIGLGESCVHLIYFLDFNEFRDHSMLS
jgi:hypothetical protein